MAILMVNPECLSPDQVKDQCLATAEADGQTAEAPNGSAAPVEVWWRGGQTCGEWMSWLQDELAEQKSRKISDWITGTNAGSMTQHEEIGKTFSDTFSQ